MSLFSFFLNANSKTYQLPLDTLTIDRLGQARSLTYLDRSAKLPEGLYILPSVISYLKIHRTDFRNLYVE